MANDGPLRTSLVWLAVIILIVGISTYSFKKMMVTYLIGMLGIAGVLLPDWDYFDRDVSEWCQPITVAEIGPNAVQRPESHRFRFYPVRTVIYATVYGFGLYKWWTYITH
ncbi:Signal peptidase complex-like protein [Drosera capensis]